MIGYGAMLTEAFVAVMALLAGTTLVPSDYFAINSTPEAFRRLNMEVVDLPELSRLVGLDVSGRPGGAISLAVGMAHIFAHIGEGLRHTMSYWFQFIIMFEALFILTTIDAGTRVARYILQDILGAVHKPLGRTDWVPGVIVTSGLVSLAWGYLLYTGDIASIWPMFGAANQTLAALALAIATTLVLRIARRKIHALITAVPLLFILVTVLAAGFMNVAMYLKSGRIVNTALTLAIIALVVVIVCDSVRAWLNLLRAEGPTGMNDDREMVYCPVVPADAPLDARP
jgi:carbon starvation protein